MLMNDLNQWGAYEVPEPMLAKIRSLFGTGWADEDQVREMIADCWNKNHYVIDPHTACGYYVMQQMPRDPLTPRVLLSTASPYKFPRVVNESLGLDASGTDFECMDVLAERPALPLRPRCAVWRPPTCVSTMSLTSTVWKVLSSRPPKLCKNSVSEAYFHIVKAISIGRPQYVDGRFSSRLLQLHARRRTSMTAPTIPASESVRQKQPAQQSNQPEQPRRKHDRLITRDMALVMLATFCFMSSNMLANPIVAGYAESLGADGMLMGAVAGSMSFISLFCRPIAGNLSDKTSKRTLVAVGTVLYFAAGLLYYFANSPIMLIMARVINGVVSHAARSAWPRGCRFCCRSGIWVPAWDCMAR